MSPRVRAAVLSPTLDTADHQSSNGIEMRAGLAIAFLKRILFGNAVLCFAIGPFDAR
ncbi:hypothetical protein [Paraburkholderia sp. JPY419]|uniref:hypothetical protein n=1 Tax=Paraburkholderia sp. JPY419 TaxID=667660 RepID=UPI003D23D023